jgi:ABC-type branched-subunit amino acid transport system substrate-binding protein
MRGLPLRRSVGARFAAAVVAVAAVAFAAGCGDSDEPTSSATTGAKACGGTPVKVMSLGDFTSAAAAVGALAPEVPPSARAAVANINRTCQLGRPVKLIVCDSQFNPNQTGKCARDAVSEKVAAVIGAWSAFGDSYMSVIAAAGIPSLGNPGQASTETTSKLSFPTWSALASLVARVTLAADTGKKHMVAAALDVPVAKFLLSIMRGAARDRGMKLSVINVPPTATDLSSFAAQAISSGADAVSLVMAAPQSQAFIKSAQQQGLDLMKTPVYGSVSLVNSRYVQTVGPRYTTGMYLSGEIMSPTNRTEPSIKRYEAELKAAGENLTPVNRTSVGVNAWGSMHMFADLMQGSKTIDAKTVAAKLNSTGLTDWSKYGIPPLNFTKSPFAGHPLLGKSRIYSEYTRVYRMGANGIPTPLTKDWVSLLHKIELSE